jgi:hypothetical protein
MLLVEDTTHDPDYSPPKKLTTQICLGDGITTFCKKQGLPSLASSRWVHRVRSNFRRIRGPQSQQVFSWTLSIVAADTISVLPWSGAPVLSGGLDHRLSYLLRKSESASVNLGGTCTLVCSADTDQFWYVSVVDFLCGVTSYKW